MTNKFIKKKYWKLHRAMANSFLRRWGPVGLTFLAVGLASDFPLTALAFLKLAIFFIIGNLVFRMLWENFLNLRPVDILLRYFSVLDILDAWKPFFSPHPNLLEVGSGTQGLGHLIPYPFWGCDISMIGNINPNMRPLIISGDKLPFDNESFDVVLSLDTIEHIPTDILRRKALLDMWRVAKKALIVGYPAGAAANEADNALRDYYRSHQWPVPKWLEEHVENGLPPLDLVPNLWEGSEQIISIPNESLRFHLWMMKCEAHAVGFFSFLGVVFLARGLIRFIGRSLLASDQPYRTIYVIAKDQKFLSALSLSHMRLARAPEVEMKNSV